MRNTSILCGLGSIQELKPLQQQILELVKNIDVLTGDLKKNKKTIAYIMQEITYIQTKEEKVPLPTLKSLNTKVKEIKDVTIEYHREVGPLNFYVNTTDGEMSSLDFLDNKQDEIEQLEVKVGNYRKLMQEANVNFQKTLTTEDQFKLPKLNEYWEAPLWYSKYNLYIKELMKSGFSKNQIAVWIRNSLDDKDKKAFKDKDTIESLLKAISEKFFIKETCKQHIIAHISRY